MVNSGSPRRWLVPALLIAAACGSGVSTAGSSPGQSRPADFSDPAPATNLQARAERGLAISPVPIKTEGLSAEDKLKVGLGSYIVNGPGTCTTCHSSPAGYLAGGNPFGVGPNQFVFSRNLTPDPDTGLQLNEWQFLDTLRTGRDRHPPADKMLIVMPWLNFRWMSEADLHAIYAYLKLIPAVKNQTPQDTKAAIPLPPFIPFPDSYTDGEVARALHYNGDYFAPLRGLNVSPLALPDDLANALISPPARTGQFDPDRVNRLGTGSYLVNAMVGCNDCHTSPDRAGNKINTAAFFTGGTVFTVPPPLQPLFHQVRAMSANLKGPNHGFFNEAGDSWTRFQSLILTGTHVDETPARPLGFPMIVIAGSIKNLIEPDLHDVYDYVKSLPNTTGASDVERQPYAVLCAADADCGGAGQTCSVATHECVGKACSVDSDCGACQTCGGGTCQAPAATSLCVATSR
jgi:hypothetical protein